MVVAVVVVAEVVVMQQQRPPVVTRVITAVDITTGINRAAFLTLYAA